MLLFLLSLWSWLSNAGWLTWKTFIGRRLRRPTVSSGVVVVVVKHTHRHTHLQASDCVFARLKSTQSFSKRMMSRKQRVCINFSLGAAKNHIKYCCTFKDLFFQGRTSRASQTANKTTEHTHTIRHHFMYGEKAATCRALHSDSD